MDGKNGQTYTHIPVMLQQSMAALALRPGMIVADGTLGGAGHAEEILKRITPGGTLIGIDKDKDAVDRAKKRLSGYDSTVHLVHSDYVAIKDILKRLAIMRLNAAILDLGVSSFQLDDFKRGFSYKQDARLDMRMDRDQKKTACEVINTYSQKSLADIIFRYGEERWAKRIAEFIADRRTEKPIETTFELTEVIKAAIPKGARQKGGHPAKRTFQAIRIEVNAELEHLQHALNNFSDVMGKAGRLAVITFHSLEDRIVKETFYKLENPCECPPGTPICICGKKQRAKRVNKKPITPEASEVSANNRARSAKLRTVAFI